MKKLITITLTFILLTTMIPNIIIFIINSHTFFHFSPSLFKQFFNRIYKNLIFIVCCYLVKRIIIVCEPFPFCYTNYLLSFLFAIRNIGTFYFPFRLYYQSFFVFVEMIACHLQNTLIKLNLLFYRNFSLQYILLHTCCVP